MAISLAFPKGAMMRTRAGILTTATLVITFTGLMQPHIVNAQFDPFKGLEGGKTVDGTYDPTVNGPQIKTPFKKPSFNPFPSGRSRGGSGFEDFNPPWIDDAGNVHSGGSPGAGPGRIVRQATPTWPDNVHFYWHSDYHDNFGSPSDRRVPSRDRPPPVFPNAPPAPPVFGVVFVNNTGFAMSVAAKFQDALSGQWTDGWSNQLQPGQSVRVGYSRNNVIFIRADFIDGNGTVTPLIDGNDAQLVTAMGNFGMRRGNVTLRQTDFILAIGP